MSDLNESEFLIWKKDLAKFRELNKSELKKGNNASYEEFPAKNKDKVYVNVGGYNSQLEPFEKLAIKLGYKVKSGQWGYRVNESV